LKGKSIQDRISLDEEGIGVTSSAGWEYETGAALSGTVKSLTNEGGKWKLLLDRQIPDVHYIRLNVADGRTYYGAVEAVRNNHLILKEDPGFVFDETNGVRFHTFPKNNPEGGLRYT